jgi:hypothetical protein
VPQLSSGSIHQGAAGETRTALEQALEAAPYEAPIHRAVAEEKRARGDELGALAHLIAAQTLDAFASGSATASAKDLCQVAAGYFAKGDHELAARWYQLVLMLDPNLAAAYQNLAAIHLRAGRAAQAEACREQAYRIQRVFVESAGNPARRILVLCVGRSAGNVPIETLLPGSTCCRIKYAIDYATEEEDELLPPYDLVLNAVGDPDVAAPLAGRLERFSQRCSRPVLNAPAAVARTQRQRLPRLLGDLDDVVVAPCILAEGPAPSRAALGERLAAGGIGLPVLARPVATHGGDGLVRCDTIEALEDALRGLDGSHYLTTFLDYRSGDGYYRKYRFIFVDRQPHPYHLAISPDWMVHYFSSGMENNPWKIAEEQRFLQDPLGALGSRAMAAVAAIGRRLDLDYGGVDLALLADGRVLVFEANATMLVHRERNNGPLAHKNSCVQRIVDAFEELQERRTTV